MKNRSRLILLVSTFCFLIVCVVLYKFGFSYSMLLGNNSRVKENNDLTYYLDISYDGKDKNVVMSSDTAVASVYSDYIYVEDKIPNGLTFKEFVNTSDGTIGAVKNGDSSQSCTGYVVDNFNGLRYDAATRMVSFKIKNLQAGCKITVGIVTTTPSLGSAARMDFYNTAFAREGSFSATSNTAHVFMGEEDATLYNVTYQYTGSVPNDAPRLPDVTSYISGSSVGVLNNVSLAGYVFSGWTSSDVTISNNSFTMPSKNVVLKGSFTKKDTYTVSYSVNGAPDGYLTPDDKDYGVGDDVTIDSLKAGDEVNGYRFLGWASSDVDLSEGIFTMPKKNVKLIGKFEKMNYKVTYKFQGSTIPNNADSLLPEEKYYYPGDTVKVANNPKVSGYRFLGWYKEKTFEMPKSDVIIYGEWMVENGVFSPRITRIIDDKKASYRKNEIISSTITIKNTASYPINNVRVEGSTDGSYFVSGDGYEVLSGSMVNVPTIAAGSSVVLKTEYVSTSDLHKKVVSEALITGATASNNYYLDTNKDYKADVEFLIFNPLLKINIKDRKNNLLTGYEFGLYSDKETSNLISKGVEFDNLEVGKTYYLRQIIAPSGYAKLNNVFTVTVSKEGKISIDGYELVLENDEVVLNINSSKLIFGNLPNTLDSILIYLGLFVISVIIIIGIVIYIRKVKNKKIQQDKDGDIEVL